MEKQRTIVRLMTSRELRQCHELNCVKGRHDPIKLALHGKNTWSFSIGWVIKQLFHGCFCGIDTTTSTRYRGQLDAPQAIMHRTVHGTSGQYF